MVSQCILRLGGIWYLFAEKYMISQKALLFDRRNISDQIMVAPTPLEIKILGKQKTRVALSPR
jgi:predicted NAD-dependent protein-ADP-ribosyltransferase YbiA (DUF1768 family)